MDQVPVPVSAALPTVGLLKRIDWPKAYLWVRHGRWSGLRVRAAKRSVTATPERGFRGAELEVSASNVSRRSIIVRDVRLMLSGAYGAPVQSSVLGELTDPALPTTLAPGEERCWYVRGEELSKLLTCLFHPPKQATRYAAATVAIYARCLTSVGRVGMSSTFEFPTDVNAHWP